VDLENERFLIDVKSTSGEFDQRIFISQGELRQIAFGIERYDIYRVYDIKNQIPKLRISRDIRDFGKTILDVFRKLPEGITPYVISISPTSMKFDSEIYLKDFD
jgi:hypothetical protein